MDEMAFEAALDIYNKEFDDAEPFDNWYPPDNDYTVMVSKIKRGRTEKDGSPFVWWKIMVTILAEDHPDVDQKSFQLAFFSNKTFSNMKTVCNQLSQNTAKRQIKEYNKEIDGYVGICANVRVHREQNPKSGKTYTAVDITQIHEPVSVDSETAAD
jgi:hypothetical protein